MNPERKQTRSWLERALRTPFEKVLDEAKITPRQREAIRLKFSEGKSNIEISFTLHVSAETVRDDLARAYDSISRALREI